MIGVGTYNSNTAARICGLLYHPHCNVNSMAEKKTQLRAYASGFLFGRGTKDLQSASMCMLVNPAQHIRLYHAQCTGFRVFADSGPEHTHGDSAAWSVLGLNSEMWSGGDALSAFLIALIFADVATFSRKAAVSAALFSTAVSPVVLRSKRWSTTCM
eukprot:scpid41250/ scgid1460/ 